VGVSGRAVPGTDDPMARLCAHFDDTYGDGVQVVKDVLASHGFALLSQVDVAAALARERPTTMAGYALLGVYVPDMIDNAADGDASAVLASIVHVAVRSSDDGVTVEAFEPPSFSAGPRVVGDLKLMVGRLRSAFDALSDAEPRAGGRA
jgi:uncharacterized protein (DUF302 family)